MYLISALCSFILVCLCTSDTLDNGTLKVRAGTSPIRLMKGKCNNNVTAK
jgi:hypothetical protein